MGTELTPPPTQRPSNHQVPTTMTSADKQRLARSVQFRHLLAALFDDDSPWGESVALQVLADHLEQDGRADMADVVRGRFQTIASNLQVTQHRTHLDTAPRFAAGDRGHLTNSRSTRAITHVIELQGTVVLSEANA